MAEFEQGQQPTHKSMHLPDFFSNVSLFLDNFREVSCQWTPIVPQFSGHAAGIISGESEQCSVVNTGDGAFKPVARLPGGCTTGRLIPFPTHCLRSGAMGCGLALWLGPLAGDGYCKGTPNRHHDCPATAAYAPPSPATAVMPFILRS